MSLLNAAGRPVPPITGIHHITAICGDAQENLDFYTGVLGLRLVKRTVNFDDPGTWHLYFGDEAGRPGSLITFFPFVGARKGRVGRGQAKTTVFSVPVGALDYWVSRLGERGVDVRPRSELSGVRAIELFDVHGMFLELHEDERAAALPAWSGGGVPAEHAIRGFRGVILLSADPGASAAFFETTLGFARGPESGGTARFHVGEGRSRAFVDLAVDPLQGRGALGSGTHHHVAFRVRDDAAQAAWRERLMAAGAVVTAVQDRSYFRSVYFREPGGVLFELATDGPGMAVDEPVASLGTALRLPPWLEDSRPWIESTLPPLHVPGSAS